MTTATDWSFTWGWILWVGFIFLLFSGVGNWGYTYQAHRKYLNFTSEKDAVDLLAERYARGDILPEEFHRMKSEIAAARNEFDSYQSTKIKNKAAYV